MTLGRRLPLAAGPLPVAWVDCFLFPDLPDFSTYHSGFASPATPAPSAVFSPSSRPGTVSYRTEPQKGPS